METYADLLRARPDTAEAVAVAVLAELGLAARCRVHVVHLASRRGAQVVRRAQADGIALTAETCPHYLALTDENYASLGAMMKVYPPIRQAADQAALWEAVQDGTITSVGSDHAPHTVEEKARRLASAPAGLPGIETLVPVLVDATLRGRLTPQRLAWVLSEGTARLLGLHPRKGAIEPGSDADFTLVDPRANTLVDRAQLHSKQPQTAWHGRELRGAVTHTILRGEVVMRHGELVGPARGRLIRAVRPAARVSPRVPAVEGMLAFTRELDHIDTRAVGPATVFGLPRV
jgi:dihydroorotase